MPEPGSITISEPINLEKSTEEDSMEHQRPGGKPKHTATSIHTETVKPAIVSEARAQALQQSSASAPPTRTTKSSTLADVPSPSRQSSKSSPLASSAEFAPAAPFLDENTKPNVPPNVLAAYRTPLYHPLTHGIPVAQLQLRSFSTRNLEFFADFCVRAAYYLSLPCTGPTPLPKKIERWTVLRSNFVHKKSQENFERITMKRLITVYDGAPEVVETWLAFVRRWQFYGVGMKANVWGWESTDVASKMDADFSNLEKELDDKLRLFGFNKHVAAKRNLLGLMERQHHRREGVGMSEVREKAREKDPNDPKLVAHY
ncbi:ribosomal protein S10 [Cladophialophora carrionii CBS 160.54]|uniref:Small ribosomal subunit protein uS10m n=1 Tax=Cladophialophora carrionii CBS 160.54 TaxID=1279043 RepID=V9D8A4_9EURO|nr:ribosomal protein S10 [Cladophialophora carrionii CBS 160.54]ETI23090.1 ribosomal protein S10 [Cladophialophora carrionii CBS 160.54]